MKALLKKIFFEGSKYIEGKYLESEGGKKNIWCIRKWVKQFIVIYQV